VAAPTIPAAGPASLDGLVERIEAALAAGRTFEAVDLARAGEADTAPGALAGRQSLQWLAALALMRSGDTAASRAAIDALEAAPRRPVRGADGARRARALEELWRTTGQRRDLDRALAVALARSRGGGFAETAAAALLAKASGDGELASRLAAKALAARREDGPADPGRLIDLARLALVRGAVADAETALAALAASLAGQPLERARARRALTGLGAYGIEVPEAALDALPPPRLVIYCGARDATLGERPAVAEAIREALAAVDAEIAYGSATAGADLLFAEAVLARRAELNLVLPCGIEAFRERLVVPGGSAWPGLFDRVVAGAASLTSVADDRQTLDQLLLQFGNRVIDGTARLRAEQLGTQPCLIAACDPLADSGPGGVADFIDHWGDPARLRLVDLDELGAGGTAGEAAPVPAATPDQRIAGLLFADVVGFTQLDDRLLPSFWRFMGAIATHMRDSVAHAPAMRRSWGDALFVLADDALSTADYAMALKAAVTAVDARAFGLPDSMQMRIALHAGPVFAGRNPLTDEAMVYGGNVNRAARIEPITVPGRVYASAPFVAWLTAAESAAAAQTALEGGLYRPRYRCTYRGVVELAKRYGPQAVYEVDPWRLETPMPEATIDGRTLTMSLINDLAEHRRLAAAFERFLEPFGYSGAALAPFEIAFDEVLTNICRYAWTDAGQHAILVEAIIEGAPGQEAVSVTIQDDGVAFDPLATAAPSLDDDIDERMMGGLGIHLVRELMDELRYCRAGPYNRLTMTKRLGTAAGGDDAAAESMEEG
jgi:anti-sigma regulatory factor (Ser/Thr protein kinase)